MCCFLRTRGKNRGGHAPVVVHLSLARLPAILNPFIPNIEHEEVLDSVHASLGNVVMQPRLGKRKLPSLLRPWVFIRVVVCAPDNETKRNKTKLEQARQSRQAE